MLPVDLEERNVGISVGPDELGVVLGTVGRRDDDLRCVSRDVIVCQDIPVGGNNKTGAERLDLIFLRLYTSASEWILPAEKPLEEGIAGERVPHLVLPLFDGRN